MKNNLLRTCKSLMLLMLVLTLQVNATASDYTPVRLTEHIPSYAIQNAAYLHQLDANTHMEVTFILPLRNQEELQELIERLYDPADEQYYGKYLSSADFIEYFAPTQEDYDKVIDYAKSLGLSIRDVHPNRTLLNVSGEARRIESAFNLQLHKYSLLNGHQFYAPDNNPEVPAPIASIITGIIGLDNQAQWRSFHRIREMKNLANSAPRAFPIGPGGSFTPSDIIRAYNLSGVQANGTNQNVALFELAGYQASDINKYATTFNLPPPKLKNVLVDGGSSSGINAEVSLDIQLVLAIAPQSTVYVYEGPNSGQGVIDTYNRIATDNIAKQVSTSWGLGEDRENSQFLQAENAIFQQMAAQGQSIYSAAGDSGAYDDFPNQNLVVDDPSSQPYVSGVGGTRLTVDAATGAYQSESVWNNGLGQGAGGGGVSTVWPIPSWQTTVSTAYSHTQRNVPDVALDGDPNTGYIIYHGGQWLIVGGTSCAAPLWAAFTALVNQGLMAAQKPVLGFANPKLYAVGAGPNYTTAFNDVTTGDNLFYHAHAGYDNATGWGSFNGANLYSSLTNSSPSSSFDLLLKHVVPFTRGGIGNYHIIVYNVGNSVIAAPITVTITLPTGLSFNSFTGAGWTFNSSTLTFTYNNAINPGSKSSTISLNVNVDAHASYTVIPTATVSASGIPSKTATNLTTTRVVSPTNSQPRYFTKSKYWD